MKKVVLNHNLENHVLEEVLEKALRGVRLSMAKPLDDPVLEGLASRFKAVFSAQMEKMLVDVGRVANA